MFIIYDLIFFIVAIVHLPVYLFRRKFHRGFWARMGFIHWQHQDAKPIWIHAVSVGEAASMRGLVGKLAKEYAGMKFIISTVTSTGNQIARTIAGDNDLVTYLPLDFSFIVRKVIDKVNPGFFIIAETEIWPNLISYLYKRNIPVVVVNGRISDKSFKGYLLIRYLLKPILNKVSLFCVQSELDAQRLIHLGVAADKVKAVGNLKFDVTLSPEGTLERRQAMGLGTEDRLIVAGSTHFGEEEAVLNAYKELAGKFPNLRLLIAPRHPERAKDIEEAVTKYELMSFRVSQLRDAKRELLNQRTIFILDTIGQLAGYYAAADIVFVGGSLVRTGGHNILEPASLEKPIIVGPHMFNFRDISAIFLKEKAVALVTNQQELTNKIREFLENPARAGQLARRAKELIQKNQGATDTTIGLIKSIYEKNSI